MPPSTKRAFDGGIPDAKSDRLSYGNNIASTARRQVVGNGHYHEAPSRDLMQTPRLTLSYFNTPGPPPGTVGTVYDEDVPPRSALPLRHIDPNVMDERKPSAKPDLSPTSADLAASCKKEHHPVYAKMMVDALDTAISASNSKKNEKGGTKKYAAKKDGGGSNGLDEYPPTLQNDGFDCTKQHENKHCATYKCRCNRATSCKFKVEMSEYGEVQAFGEPFFSSPTITEWYYGRSSSSRC